MNCPKDHLTFYVRRSWFDEAGTFCLAVVVAIFHVFVDKGIHARLLCLSLLWLVARSRALTRHGSDREILKNKTNVPGMALAGNVIYTYAYTMNSIGHRTSFTISGSAFTSVAAGHGDTRSRPFDQRQSSHDDLHAQRPEPIHLCVLCG